MCFGSYLSTMLNKIDIDLYEMKPELVEPLGDTEDKTAEEIEREAYSILRGKDRKLDGGDVEL